MKGSPEAHGDPAPLSAHTSLTRGKTCFVPVYFLLLVEKSVSKQGPDVDTLAAVVLLTLTMTFGNEGDKIYKLD